jgi:uncharacterized protein YodC (DUF2158 family)
MNRRSQENVKEGDVVRLNSGGPDMKIVSIVNNLVMVEWKNGKKDVERSSFPIVCVCLVSA